MCTSAGLRLRLGHSLVSAFTFRSRISYFTTVSDTQLGGRVKSARPFNMPDFPPTRLKYDPIEYSVVTLSMAKSPKSYNAVIRRNILREPTR